MKVLHIIDTLWLGGAQSVVKTYFEKQGYNADIFLYVLRQSEPQITINHKNIVVHSSFSRYSLSAIREISNLVKQNKIHVLHCHLPRSQVFGYILKRFYFPEIKLVFHEQGIIYDHPVVLPFLFNLFKKQVNAFIACSERNKADLLSKVKGIEKKVFYLPNFVDVAIADKMKQSDKMACREKLKLSKADFVIGYAGRIVERKGWRELIGAAIRLKNENDIHWLISGIGPEVEEMLSLIRKNKIQNKVRYLGYVEDMIGFYVTIDCLVLPSHWEGMSLSQQEALAAEVPVLVSENLIGTSQGEFIVFKNKDANDLARKVLEVKSKVGSLKPDKTRYSVLVENEKLFMEGLENMYKSI